MMDAYKELVMGGDTRLHHHLEDRIPTHETLRALQAAETVVEVSADYTVREQDDLLEVSTAGGSVNISLLTGRRGKTVTVSKLSALNTLTITPSGGQTINGAASLVLLSQWASKTLKYVGNDDWRVIASA